MRLPSKILVLAVLAAGACGGAADSPPGPLATHFDDMYIATIAPSQKPTVVQTQQDWSVARSSTTLRRLMSGYRSMLAIRFRLRSM